MTHSELCYLTAKHFVKSASIAFWEVSISLTEKPDALVLNSSGKSTLYEIKMSHSDFKADFNKECRKEPMFGDKRYYVCPEGVIPEDEVPPDWGLYYYKKNKFYLIKQPCNIKDFSKNGKYELNKYKYLTWVLINELICKKPNVIRNERYGSDQLVFGGSYEGV